MMKLRVLAEVEGVRRVVGEIETFSGRGERFTYCDEWIAPPEARPLSLSLPVSEKVFDAPRMRPYFEGLLPEEDARRNVAAELGVKRTSYLKLLEALGYECIGAVLVMGEGDAGEPVPTPRYKALAVDDLDDMLSTGYSGTSRVLVGSRLSLAGAQAKIGLYRPPQGDGTWYLPCGTAPATHIIKPANDRFDGMVLNEQLSLSVARRCGLSVPDSFIIDGSHPALAVKRYDRSFFGDEETADGLVMPSRLHQEDFCQALGILTSDKYETGANRYLGDVANLIRAWSSNPIDDLNRLWDILVFDYFIGNCDNHIKNLSIVRSRDWSSLRLAPSYDLVNTTIYSTLTRTMGITVGSTRDIDRITRDDFALLAKTMGVSGRVFLTRLDDMRTTFGDALVTAAGELAESGHLEAHDIANRIASDAAQRIARMAPGKQ